MKIAEINMLSNGSTGKIMLQVADTARAAGHKVKTYSPVRFVRGKRVAPPDIPDHLSWGTREEAMLHYYVGTLLGRNGMYSKKGTRQLIYDLKKFSPDIIHLHNLHMYCINLPMLFDYIKENRIKVVWTLHDCWPFTGHCPHFVLARCDKWKTECKHCPQPRVYPKMYLDTSKMMYRLKKRWFLGVENMTIVTPSKWLANLVKESFLKDYPVKVINNGIDLSVFTPRESNFRKTYKLENKKVILGVAFDWGYRKGLDIFIELAKRLALDRYQIVLVGTNEMVDEQLPENILSIHSTNNQIELAEIYSAADLFVNPTREENFPTVNMEALACGIPVVTFKTGGSPEVIDSTCGRVVEVDDIDALEREVIHICESTFYPKVACLERAKSFDMYERFGEYIELYEGARR